MKKAALYVHGRVVTAESHLAAFEALTLKERKEYIVSGFIDEETGEFDSDLAHDHFYNKEIYLVRHGDAQTNENPDPPITEKGTKQAKELAETLSKKNLSDFFCITSPLLRCLQTAQIFNEICGLKFVVDLSLIETPHFLNDPSQSFWLKNRCHEFSDFNWLYKHDWRIRYESKPNFNKRVRYILEHLPEQSFLISHFGVIMSMASFALCGDKAMEHGVPTASLTHIDNQEIKCLGQISDVSH